jgi:hypothetical protein
VSAPRDVCAPVFMHTNHSVRVCVDFIVSYTLVELQQERNTVLPD